MFQEIIKILFRNKLNILVFVIVLFIIRISYENISNILIFIVAFIFLFFLVKDIFITIFKTPTINRLFTKLLKVKNKKIRKFITYFKKSKKFYQKEKRYLQALILY
ncbi:hypothetical protein BZ13_73 [Francisella philomiragia subsp. philomiragia ATCC 25015]|nr:hypothetical protein BZ13_73 [Francisella philomiragia subsp. philomiragia ATCC 25015]EET21662.1 predicted protein [Francisella philomiragia subsp. philomiragia ATCC 25015]